MNISINTPRIISLLLFCHNSMNDHLLKKFTSLGLGMPNYEYQKSFELNCLHFITLTTNTLTIKQLTHCFISTIVCRQMVRQQTIFSIYNIDLGVSSYVTAAAILSALKWQYSDLLFSARVR